MKEHVYQRGLSRIGASEKSKLGNAYLREVLTVNCPFDELGGYDLEHTGCDNSLSL